MTSMIMGKRIERVSINLPISKNINKHTDKISVFLPSVEKKIFRLIR